MEYVELGSTSLSVSRIAFGCWAMGGHGYGTVDDGESVSAVRKALELGVNFFDTADVYGFGHSERILSKALGSRRHDVVIGTKFGVNWDDSGKTHKDCSPKRAVEALEGSLRRLGIERIPLYQIHWHDGVTPIPDLMEALLRCREAGKIQYIGCSNFSDDLVGKACLVERPASIQALFNVARRQNEGILANCFEREMGVLAYGVLSRGLFSGKYDESSKFGEKDTRPNDGEFNGERLTKNLRIADRLRELGRQYGKSAVQVAIRWTLDAPFVSSAIVGIKNIPQAVENIGALSWSLDRGHWTSLSILGNE